MTTSERVPERVGAGPNIPRWSCRAATAVGDRVLVHIEGLGIRYVWRVTSDDDSRPVRTNKRRVEYGQTFDPPITFAELRNKIPRKLWVLPHLTIRGPHPILVPDRAADRVFSLRPLLVAPVENCQESNLTREFGDVSGTVSVAPRDSLSTRAANTLWDLGIDGLGALLAVNDEQLRQCPDCGPKTVDEILKVQEALSDMVRVSGWDSAKPRADALLTRQCLTGADVNRAPVRKEQTWSSQLSSAYAEVNISPEVIFVAARDSLSVRAANILQALGVDDLEALMAMNEEQLLACRNCGRKTVDEILKVQESISSKVADDKFPASRRTADLLSVPWLAEVAAQRVAASEETNRAHQVSRIYADLDDAPEQVYVAVRDSLSVRAANVLRGLGVDGLRDFMRLDEEQLLACRNCGRTSVDQIAESQNIIKELARQVAQRGTGLQPNEIATCLNDILNARANAGKDRGRVADAQNPVPWLKAWINGISRSDAESRAFMLRKGMLGRPPMTLELVGEDAGLTRERIRQIEQSIEKRLSVPHQQQRLTPLTNAAAAVVSQHGGLLELDELTKAVLCHGENGSQLSFATNLMEFFSTLQVWRNAGLRLIRNGVASDGTSRSVVNHLAGVITRAASEIADERHAGLSITHIFWSSHAPQTS